jgi:hypothetical protein
LAFAVGAGGDVVVAGVAEDVPDLGVGEGAAGDELSECDGGDVQAVVALVDGCVADAVGFGAQGGGQIGRGAAGWQVDGVVGRGLRRVVVSRSRSQEGSGAVGASLTVV